MPIKRSLRTTAPQRETRTKIIIACEGAKTERGYFEGIRRSLRLSEDLIYVVRHQNTDPLGIVELAIEAKQEARQWGGFVSAWAVFDGDEHRHNAPARENWNNALQKAKAKKIELAISNPAFELWYLLHYQDQRSYLDRSKARELLRKHLPDYEKADRLYPDRIGERTADAIARAKKMAASSEANNKPLFHNPSCGVWRLVEMLLMMAQN